MKLSPADPGVFDLKHPDGLKAIDGAEIIAITDTGAASAGRLLDRYETLHDSECDVS